MDYFKGTKSALAEIKERKDRGEKLSLEDEKFYNGASRQMIIQGILAMSETELTKVKGEFCEYLRGEEHKYPKEQIGAAATLYERLTPEEFKASMLRPSSLGEAIKYSFNAVDYIVSGPHHGIYYPNRSDFSYGMGYDAYSREEIEGANMSPESLEIIKRDAEQRAQDVETKLKSGMNLYDATHSPIEYINEGEMKK